MPPTQAFLSYTRDDDNHFGGVITELRHAVELAVRVVTGDKSFEVFQDIDGIELGQEWQSRLDQAISESRFLMPVITPLFFSSPACRDELTKFMASEERSGREDLILPIYFVTTPALEKNDQLAQDPLAAKIGRRQRHDWRPNAYLSANDPRFRQEVRFLAEKIAVALRRTVRLGRSPSATDNISDSFNPPTRVTAGSRYRSPIAEKTVLWVDDRPDNNIAERDAMQRYGLRFTLCESTEEALLQLTDTKFDAVISDMGRPPDQEAGYTLLKSIRSAGNPVPYFIYAGSASPEHVAEALNRGAQGSTNSSTTLIQSVMRAIKA